MIVGLSGMVAKLEGNLVVLEVRGVLYGVHVSLLCGLELKVGDEARLWITEVIREDAYLLFGFLDPLEQKIFERLIKINGVGPKVALAILSSFSPIHFSKIIETKDVRALQAVPGIGAKGASKIMVDLAGFFDFSQDGSVELEAKREASMALEGLGFKKSEIDRVLKKIVAHDTPTVIKEALRFFQQK
ncbi:Holliday junction branch migration protein RuvA [Helicobacter pametensis]|uniref:Holliday junction branch migration protein RuvA n=1 Tax=Helicobacter pametensis TaxID=95149 RepID=UPI0004856FF0|nr:Holliday junction branch migration protein RuvA [Helicobacter pametensis]